MFIEFEEKKKTMEIAKVSRKKKKHCLAQYLLPVPIIAASAFLCVCVFERLPILP